MHKTPDGEVHVTKTEARAGSTPGVVRYVLGISIALAIAAMLWVFLDKSSETAPDSTTVSTGVETEGGAP